MTKVKVKPEWNSSTWFENTEKLHFKISKQNKTFQCLQAKTLQSFLFSEKKKNDIVTFQPDFKQKGWNDGISQDKAQVLTRFSGQTIRRNRK